jgi:hypothetical protein
MMAMFDGYGALNRAIELADYPECLDRQTAFYNDAVEARGFAPHLMLPDNPEIRRTQMVTILNELVIPFWVVYAQYRLVGVEFGAIGQMDVDVLIRAMSFPHIPIRPTDGEPQHRLSGLWKVLRLFLGE